MNTQLSTIEQKDQSVLADLSLHHLGLAVKDDKEALRMLAVLGYRMGDRCYDPKQNVYVRLCSAIAHPTVEIVQPGDEGKSPIDSILASHNTLIYHTCYETPDLDITLQGFRNAGLRLMRLSERKPAVLFDGRHVSFYMIAGWGIIELLEVI